MLLAGGVVGTAGLDAELVPRAAREVASAGRETGEVGPPCALSPATRKHRTTSARLPMVPEQAGGAGCRRRGEEYKERLAQSAA